jgi:hypothetical protein
VEISSADGDMSGPRMQQQKGHSTPPIVHTKTRKHRPRSVVGKKKKKKKKKKEEARGAKWLAFWQTATRLPVIPKRTIQHRQSYPNWTSCQSWNVLAHM